MKNNDELSQAEIDRNHNALILSDELNENEPRQSVITYAIQKLLASDVLLTIEPGKFDILFEKLLEGLKPDVTKCQEILGNVRGKLYGQETYTELLEFAILAGLKTGVQPVSMQAAVYEWWNRQADAGMVPKMNFRVFQRMGPKQIGKLFMNSINPVLEQLQVYDASVN